MTGIPSFREKEQVDGLLRAIRRKTDKEWTIMEICGGQTHAIARYRLEELLPSNIHLVHGPGCPVCVTPQHIINQAITLALRPEVIFSSFGDMLRVPGSTDSLMTAKAKGADVRIVYSPLDAVTLAKNNPEKQVIFFGIGFETTAPVHALAIKQARHLQLSNFSLLSSLVTVPPAIRTLMDDPDNKVQALLAAGHVCAITGYTAYHVLAADYQMPISVTGFEPVDILWGIYNCLDQLVCRDYTVRNAYPRIVNAFGNAKALQIISDVFEPCDQEWRGLGVIPQSGLRICKEYELYDAMSRFNVKVENAYSLSSCRSGEVLRGKIHPCDCPEFGKGCTPDHPLGASMVSSEGACAAYYKYNPSR